MHNHRGRTLNLMGRGDRKRLKLYRMEQTEKRLKARIAKQQEAVDLISDEDTSSSDSETGEMDEEGKEEEEEEEDQVP